MVMASTTMTSEPVDAAASVINEVPDAAPAPSAASISAADAIAQVALAKGIAFVAHRGKHDRSGAPYIDHPGRIAERFDPVTRARRGCGRVAARRAGGHAHHRTGAVRGGGAARRDRRRAAAHARPDITPDEYYAGIRRDPVARRVKLADIDDNTARWRLRRLDYDTQLRLVEKYRYARQALGTD